MTIQELVPIALKASLALVLIPASLLAQPGDAFMLFSRPSLLGRTFLSMSVIAPLFAAWLVIVVPVPLPVKVAIVTLSLAPVPPLLPGNVAKHGAHGAYGISLMFTMSLIAIGTIPAAMLALAWLFGASVSLPMAKIFELIVTSLIAPLVAGVILRFLFHGARERIAKVAKVAGMLLLVVAVIPILIKAWPVMWELVGNGTVAVTVAFVLVMSFVGYALGGPSREDRAVLALASASRHPAIAVTISSALFPEQRLAPAAVLLALVVGAVAQKVISRAFLKPAEP